MDREILGRPTAEYLWKVKKVVPILKVDKGLEAEANGVQLMKPMPGLDAAASTRQGQGHLRHQDALGDQAGEPGGIRTVVDQQFAIARQIIAAGLVPIIEPEVDIDCPDKAAGRRPAQGRDQVQLEELQEGQQVMLKLTLPSHDNLYAECIKHPRVLRVVALSGGYSRDEANARLARQHDGGELLAGADRGR